MRHRLLLCGLLMMACDRPSTEASRSTPPPAESASASAPTDPLLRSTVGAVARFKRVQFGRAFAVVDAAHPTRLVGIRGRGPRGRTITFFFEPGEVSELNVKKPVQQYFDRHLSAIVTRFPQCFHLSGVGHGARDCAAFRPKVTVPELSRISTPRAALQTFGGKLAERPVSWGAGDPMVAQLGLNPARGGPVRLWVHAANRDATSKDLLEQPVVGVSVEVSACHEVTGTLHWNRDDYRTRCDSSAVGEAKAPGAVTASTPPAGVVGTASPQAVGSESSGTGRSSSPP